MSAINPHLNNINLFSNEVWAKHLSPEMIDAFIDRLPTPEVGLLIDRLPKIEGICQKFLTERRGRTLIQKITDQHPGKGHRILERLSETPDFPDFVIHFDSLGNNLLMRAFKKNKPQVIEPIGKWLREHRETQAPLLACFEALAHPEDRKAQSGLYGASSSRFAFAQYLLGRDYEKAPHAAQSFYELAAAQDFLPATVALARLLDLRDPQRARSLYERTAPFNSKAALGLARLVSRTPPLGNAASLQKYIQLTHQAKNMGDPEAYIQLERFLDGDRLRLHYCYEALQLFQEHENTRHWLACVDLGEIYLRDKRDPQMALHFLEMAGKEEPKDSAELNIYPSLMSLIIDVYRSIGDEEQAAYWERRLER